MPKPLYESQQTGKFLHRWEYQTTLPASWEICVLVKKQQLEPHMEQLGKEYVKAVYCHPAYLTHIQSTSWETLGWMKHKLESSLLGEISITSDMQMTPPYGRKQRGTKEPFDENEREAWKSWLKTQHLKTKIMASSPITSWQRDGETMETVRSFISGGSKVTADGDCSHEIKRCLLLGRKAMTNLESILKSRVITLQYSWNYESCHVGPPKTDGSWWRVLPKHAPLEKGMANHFSILALRTPWKEWKGKKIGYWKINSPGW